MAGGPGAPPAFSLRGCFTTLPLRVVDQLAHGDRRNRHRDDVLARGRRDFRGRGEPGTNVRHVLVEHDDDLEVRRLLVGRRLSGGLNRAVADFSHVSLERAIGDRVDRDLGLLSHRHVRDVRFVDFDLRLNHGHVRDRQQHGAGIVHRPDDGRFAFLDVPARDDTGDWRLDADLAEIELRAGQLRAILSKPDFLRAHLLLALGEGRLRDSHVVLRAFQRFARGELLFPQLLLTFQILLCDGQLHTRRLDSLTRLFETCLIGLQGGLTALDPRPKRPRIDLHQELSQLHAVAFVDRKIDDPPGRVGADVDEPFRLDLARCRHDGLEIARADGLDGDGGRGGASRPPRVSAGRTDEDESQHGDDDLLVSGQLNASS